MKTNRYINTKTKLNKKKVTAHPSSSRGLTAGSIVRAMRALARKTHLGSGCRQNNERVITKKYEYIKTVLSKVPGSIYWKDINGVYLGGNEYAALMAGVDSVDQLIGKTDYELFPKKVADKYRKNDIKVIKEGIEIADEEVGVFRHQQEKIFQISIKSPLCDKEGNICGVIGNTIDITERKQLQELLLKAKEEKIQAMKALAGAIAHELRTPLAALRCSAQGIQNYFPLLVKGYQIAKAANLPVEVIRPSILDSLSSLTDNIKEILNSSNMMIDIILANIQEEFQNKDKFKEYNIVKTINEALEIYPFSKDMKCKIEWDRHQKSFSYFGDCALTKHIFFNLFKNALYFLSNRAEPKITITLKRENNYNYVIFQDNGPGISKDILPDIFERFFSRRQSGTDIGLAFCKSVMESYDGMISCESEEEKHTTFILQFPLCKSTTSVV